MFTGIIESIGDIIRVRRGSNKIELTIKLPFDAKIGDSISIDGVCLTVKEISENVAKFDAVSETIEKTTLKFVREGKRVNLERALSGNERFGGHIVLGHIDGIGKIKIFKKGVEEGLIKVEYPDELKEFIAKKGSIALDGISLTISDVNKNEFSVSLIPFTIGNTSLQYKKEGDYINIEVDVIARYVKRIMEVNRLWR